MIQLQTPANVSAFKLPGSDINFGATFSINNTAFPNSSFSLNLPSSIIIPGANIGINSIIKLDIAPFVYDAKNNLVILNPGLHIEMDLQGTTQYTVHMIIPFNEATFTCNDFTCPYIVLQFDPNNNVLSPSTLGITYNMQVNVLNIGKCGSL